MKVNRMHIRKLSQKVRWFGGNGMDFHASGPRFNFDKWHVLWSTMVSWLNVLYLHIAYRVD
jgi:hypothetical protein